MVDQKDFKLDYRLTLGLLSADKDKEIENEDQKVCGRSALSYFGENTRILLSGYYMKDNGYFYWEDFLDYTSTFGTAARPVTAGLNQYSTQSFSPGRSQDAFWDNQDSFINVTFLTKLTDNANLRLAYFNSDIVDRRRIVRGITITPDNHTLVRQDIPLEWTIMPTISRRISRIKLHYRGVKLDSTLGADRILQYSRQDQSVNNMPSLDTANVTWTADDALFSVPRPGAGMPHTSQQITRPESSRIISRRISVCEGPADVGGGLRWFHPEGTIRTTSPASSPTGRTRRSELTSMASSFVRFPRFPCITRILRMSSLRSVARIASKAMTNWTAAQRTGGADEGVRRQGGPQLQTIFRPMVR